MNSLGRQSSATMKNILLIFTTSYPYGKGEQYLENELEYYSDQFDKIYFFPVKLEGEPRVLPTNAEVVDLHQKVHFERKQLFKILWLYLKFLKIEKKERKDKIPPDKKRALLKSFYNAYFYGKALQKWCNENVKDDAQVTFYSYWFYHWVLVFALSKKDLKVKASKFISRAHLGDVYDYYQYNLWAGVKLKTLDHLLSISDHARAYYLDHFKTTSCIEVSRLGIPTHAVKPSDETAREDVFQLVSCSSIREAKRVHFIIEILQHCQSKINWIHFGGGPMEKQVKAQAKSLPVNVNATFKGFVPNQEIIDFYQKNKIHLFINVSSHEGVPVSIMEATSFGIPVLGTNVFGTPEIVNENTGILIDVEAKPEAVGKKIDAFLNTPDTNRKATILKFHKEKFDAGNNYRAFTRKYLL